VNFADAKRYFIFWEHYVFHAIHALNTLRERIYENIDDDCNHIDDDNYYFDDKNYNGNMKMQTLLTEFIGKNFLNVFYIQNFNKIVEFQTKLHQFI